MLTEKIFDASGVMINYAEGPSSGPPLVMLHGIPGLWQELLPILPGLMVHWHIYALDLRGQGKSGRVAGGYHSSFYSKDVASFIRRQFSEPVVLFGNSAGGLIALDTATKVPEKIRAIILGDSPIDMDWLLGWMTSAGFKAFFTALRSIAQLGHSIPDMISELAALPIVLEDGKVIRYGDRPDIDRIHLTQLATTLKYLDADVLEYHAEGRAAEYQQGFDLDACLGHASCPVLLIQANPDLGGMMTERSVNYALARLKQGYHVYIKEVGHDLGLEHGEVVPLLRALSAFLNSL